MKVLNMWFYISCKRQLKRKSFLAVMVLLPILTLAFNTISNQKESRVTIGLYSDGSDLGNRIIEDLINYEGVLNFYPATSEEELYDKVMSEDIECGYLFYHDMEDNVKDGRTKRQIGLITSPSTVLDELSMEIIYSRFMKLYSEDVLRDFAKTSSLLNSLNSAKSMERLSELYHMFLNNGSTFSFEYRTISQEVFELKELNMGNFPIRGVAAIYIFLIGLFSTVYWYRDRRIGIFLSVPFLYKKWVNIISIGTPVLIGVISAIASLRISGTWTSFGNEVISMFLYAIAVILFCEFLRRIFRDGIKLCSIIPTLTLGSFIFCPIIINVKDFIPFLGIVEKLFLPYYYMTVFITGSVLLLLGFLALEIILFIFWRQDS